MKKIFYFIMLCLMGIALASCGESSSKAEKMVAEMNEAIAENNFEKAHSLLKQIKQESGFQYEWNVDALYGAELKYIATSDVDNIMLRIKLLLADLTPTDILPTDYKSMHIGHYNDQAAHYNAFCEKAIDILLALGKKSDAITIANMIRPVAVENKDFTVSISEQQKKEAIAKITGIPVAEESSDDVSENTDEQSDSEPEDSEDNDY